MAQLWGGRFKGKTDELVYAFNASINFDKRLYKQDIEGSKAHVKMLCRQNVLTKQDTDAILEGMSLIRTSCLKVLMNPESMNLILSKLDKDLLAKHMDHENVMDLSGLETMAKKKGINVDELAAAFTMILFGGMYTDVIGEKNLGGSTRMLVRGLVKQIFE